MDESPAGVEARIRELAGEYLDLDQVMRHGGNLPLNRLRPEMRARMEAILARRLDLRQALRVRLRQLGRPVNLLDRGYQVRLDVDGGGPAFLALPDPSQGAQSNGRRADEIYRCARADAARRRREATDA